jgi:HlyD family secretion protein
MPTTPPTIRPQAQPGYLSPDQLNQLFVVIRPRGWLALLALTLMGGAALVWACLARVPETVEGAGVLVSPGRVRPVQSQFGGQVIELRVRPGQDVRKGDVLAIINQPEVQEQLAQARTRLAELDNTEAAQSKLEALRTEQEKSLRHEQDRLLERSVAEAETLLVRVEEQIKTLTREQRQQAEASRKEVLAAKEALREQVAAVRKLVEQKLATVDRLLTLEANLLESSLTLANLDTRIVEANFKEADYRTSLAQQKQRVAELAVQRLGLGVRATQLEQEIAQAKAGRQLLRQEQFERVRRLQVQLREGAEITSPYAGRVVELAIQPGQLMQPGGRVGAIELAARAETPPLVHLAYFAVASGKRIQPGMQVRVTPTTLQRERFGSIIGVVRKVSAFPISAEAAASIIGNTELVRGLLPPAGMIEVEVELEKAETPSGYRWTSAGPPVQLSAGTTTRTRVVVERRPPISYLMPVLRTLWEGADEAGRPEGN